MLSSQASVKNTVVDSVVVHVARALPELATPEEEASEMLQVLKHLPAQPPVVSTISSPYGWRIDPMDPVRKREQFHRGIDFDVPAGTQVVAPAPGIVVSVQKGGNYGRYLKIRHDQSGYMTLLAHLSKVGVEAGDAVRRGEVVAYSGGASREDGRSTGPHVHFEIRRMKDGQSTRETIDPVLVFDLYWEVWDTVQEFPFARIRALYRPYTLSMSRTLHNGALHN